jgi:reactive intermediate/imine deaminase
MKEAITTVGAPKAIGPYSQAIKLGKIVYLSGQIALDPSTGEIVGGEGGVEVEMRRVLENLNAVARASGGSLTQVAKLTIYLTDLADFGKLNEIMKDYFAEPYPARATIGVAQLPRNVRVEIDAILHLD